jgi:hypothetical protein
MFLTQFKLELCLQLTYMELILSIWAWIHLQIGSEFSQDYLRRKIGGLIMQLMTLKKQLKSRLCLLEIVLVKFISFLLTQLLCWLVLIIKILLDFLLILHFGLLGGTNAVGDIEMIQC